MPRIVISRETMLPHLYQNISRNDALFGQVRSRNIEEPGIVGLRYRPWKRTFDRIFDRSRFNFFGYNYDLNNSFVPRNEGSDFARLIEQTKISLINQTQVNNEECLVIIQSLLNIIVEAKNIQYRTTRVRKIDVLIVANSFNNNIENYNNKVVLYLRRETFDTIKNIINVIINNYNDLSQVQVLFAILEAVSNNWGNVEVSNVTHEPPPARRRGNLNHIPTDRDHRRTHLGQNYQGETETPHYNNEALFDLMGNIRPYANDEIMKKLKDLLDPHIDFRTLMNVVRGTNNIPENTIKEIEKIIAPLNALLFSEEENQQQESRVTPGNESWHNLFNRLRREHEQDNPYQEQENHISDQLRNIILNYLHNNNIAAAINFINTNVQPAFRAGCHSFLRHQIRYQRRQQSNI